MLRECPLALPLHPDHVQPVTFAVAPDGTLRGAESVTLLGSGEHADRTRDALRLRAADGALVFEDLRVDPLARSAEALIRGQLSTAARVPLFEVRRVVKSDGPLKWASAGRSRSLTLLLAVRSHSKSIRDRLCLDWSLSVPPDRISPVVFQEELEREIGKFTVLQLADIRDYRCRVGKSTVGTYAQGSVRVEHRGSFGWKLVVKWRARLEGARWRIHEFVLPKGQLALRQEKAGSPWSLIDLRENTSDREAQEGR